MSAVDSVSALASQLESARGGAQPRDRLGQEQFLELMVAQMQNQDPFKPVDPTQFLGQLAQFGTVSGIQDMQGAIATLADSLRTSQVLDGATLVGRGVLAEGDALALGAQGEVRGALDVPAGATSVEVSIRDASGQFVRGMQVAAEAGLQSFAWDGRTDRGERAAPGAYRFSAIARVAGESESVPALVESRIHSVTIDPRGRGLLLNTDLGPLTLADVRRVM